MDYRMVLKTPRVETPLAMLRPMAMFTHCHTLPPTWHTPQAPFRFLFCRGGASL